MKRITSTLVMLSISAALMAQVGTGLEFKFGRTSGFTKKNAGSLGFAGKLPASFSLKGYTPYAKNQGNYGTCVSWAMAYGAMTTQYAINMGLTNRNIITSMAFCPYFTHNNSKQVTDGCVSGNWFYDVAGVLTETGVKRFYLPSIGCGTPNDANMLVVAKNYRVTEVNDIYVYTDLTSADYGTYLQNFVKKTPFKVDDIKEALNSNYPVVFGMYLPPSFNGCNTELWEPSAIERANPVQALLDNKGEMHASHAMTIIGYDDTKYGGAFEILNSWGPNWGDNGFAWVRYADLQMYAFECLTIEMPKLTLTATTGCIYGDCNQGYGIYKYSNGDIYDGFFKANKRNGYGIYAWSNGSVYAGEWADDLRSGDALFYFSDGSYGGVKYANDKFQSGFNKYTFEGGDTYEGNVTNGSFDGYGVYHFSDGSSYEGKFGSGNYNGMGKYVFKDGGYYIGYFVDGQRHGKGLYVSNDGKVWGGEWSYDKFSSGKTYGFANSNQFNFEMGDIGSNMNYLDANCTSGDCLNGKGVRRYTSGSTYEGDFKDGIENGIGKVTYSNGASAELFYNAGSIVGPIVCKFANGGLQIGSFKNGDWDGYIVYFDPAGSPIIGLYKNGNYVGKLSSANVGNVDPGKMTPPPSAGFKSMPTSVAGK